MHNIKSLNTNYVKCFLKNWNNLTEKEESLLTKRKNLLNSNFKFTRTTIEKLRKINNCIEKLEERVKSPSDFIFNQLIDWRKQKIIDSYGVDVIVQCFNTDYYVQWHKDFEGNPFYHFLSLMDSMNRIKNHDAFCETNFNSFQLKQEHPLTNEKHCHSFNHLYTNTYLAWEDILRIEEISVIVVAQNEFTAQI